MTRLKDVAEILAGQSPPSDQVDPLDSGLPFLQGNAEFGPRHPSARYECDIAPKRAIAGDVLVSVRAPVGAVNVADRAFGIGRGLCAVRAHSIDPGYLWWWIQSTRSELESRATGSTFTAITSATLGSLELPDIPAHRQGAIADYLDRETAQIDTLIAKQEQLVRALGLRAKSATDAITSRISALRSTRLKYLYSRSAQTSIGGETVLSVFREFGVVPKADGDGNFNRTPEDLSRYLAVDPGDLVVNKMKAWQGSLGISDHRGIVSGDYEVARPTSGDWVPAFAHAYLRSPRMIFEYARRSTGIRPSQWRLYWDEFGDIEVPLPDKSEQLRMVRQLADQTAKIDALIAKAQQFITLAKERRAALITAAVTGQIDVTTGKKRAA